MSKTTGDHLEKLINEVIRNGVTVTDRYPFVCVNIKANDYEASILCDRQEVSDVAIVVTDVLLHLSNEARSRRSRELLKLVMGDEE